jgi:hypothetical protein
MAGASIEIPTPDPNVVWRTRTPGQIERSTDAGLTWKAQRLRGRLVVIAGSAPSRDVLWIVGAAGAVLLTTDGGTWRSLQFPERTDLAAVTAIDARTATVTASDGRRFSTTDGGTTWSRPPLQESPAAPF